MGLVVIEAASRSHIAPSEVIRFDFRFFHIFSPRQKTNLPARHRGAAVHRKGGNMKMRLHWLRKPLLCLFARCWRCLFGTMEAFIQAGTIRTSDIRMWITSALPRGELKSLVAFKNIDWVRNVWSRDCHGVPPFKEFDTTLYTHRSGCQIS